MLPVITSSKLLAVQRRALGQPHQEDTILLVDAVLAQQEEIRRLQGILDGIARVAEGSDWHQL